MRCSLLSSMFSYDACMVFILRPDSLWFVLCRRSSRFPIRIRMCQLPQLLFFPLEKKRREVGPRWNMPRPVLAFFRCKNGPRLRGMRGRGVPRPYPQRPIPRLFTGAPRRPRYGPPMAMSTAAALSSSCRPSSSAYAFRHRSIPSFALPLHHRRRLHLAPLNGKGLRPNYRYVHSLWLCIL
jgi:hypothetical protein